MTVAAVAYINGRQRQWPTRNKGAHLCLNKGHPGCKRGGLCHNGQNDIYSQIETSGTRWGAFFGFSRPTLKRFSHILVSHHFWRTTRAFSKMTIFFKLQAGMSLVSSTSPPRPRRARATLAPHPKSTISNHSNDAVARRGRLHNDNDVTPYADSGQPATAAHPAWKLCNIGVLC